MDSCVIPLHHGDLALLQTTDYFYPLVEDPYMMGRIACANVVSDLYAMGVAEIDNMLMLLGLSTQMTEREREVVTTLMIQGFKDAASEAGTKVTGGETVENPWCTIGGVATSVCRPTEYIVPENAEVGDVLVLTKPLGTQIAVAAYSWLDNPDRLNKIKTVVTEEDVRMGYERAMDSMARLNKIAASVMTEFKAKAATDVTGFGILGHAHNLAKFQKNEVSFVIHNLPVIAQMATIADTAMGKNNRLMRGTSPETSGGLLVCLARDTAAGFCKEMERREGRSAWIIGVVERGDRTARLIENPRIIQVPATNTNGKLW